MERIPGDESVEEVLRRLRLLKMPNIRRRVFRMFKKMTLTNVSFSDLATFGDAKKLLSWRKDYFADDDRTTEQVHYFISFVLEVMPSAFDWASVKDISKDLQDMRAHLDMAKAFGKIESTPPKFV